MNNLSAVLASIETPKVREYFFRPLPDVVDGSLIDCLHYYASVSDRDRETIRRLVDTKHSYGLLAFAERMAVLGVREHSTDRIYFGLLAIALEDYRFDAREDTMILALLLNSTRKIDADPIILFDLAAGKARKEVGQSMRTFAQQNKDNKKIVQSMGYKEILVNGAFSYTRGYVREEK